MKIRKATTADNLSLSALCVDVQRLHAENYPNLFKNPENDSFAGTFFAERLAEPAVTIYIAEESAQAVGYIFCKLVERPETAFTHAERLLNIEHISVRPGIQRRGIGAALLKRAEELAQEIGVTKIQLGSWGFNTQAHAFFERHGFAKVEHRFWKSL